MRRGIGLRGYAQQDPLNEFKREAFQLYDELRGPDPARRRECDLQRHGHAPAGPGAGWRSRRSRQRWRAARRHSRPGTGPATERAGRASPRALGRQPERRPAGDRPSSAAARQRRRSGR
jgi:preprotein translocase subunit SecA